MKNGPAALVFVGIVLVACKLGDSKPAGNCNAKDTPDKGFCFEYPKSDVESGKRVCKDFPGVWTEGACDRTGALGACKLSTGITKVFYSGSVFASEEDAKKQCYDKWVGPSEQ